MFSVRYYSMSLGIMDIHDAGSIVARGAWGWWGDEGVTLFYDVVRARTAAKQGFGSLAAA